VNPIDTYLDAAAEVIRRIDRSAIEKTVRLLTDVKRSGGRIFFIGAGGSAANASHAVNDFRKIAGMEAYAATDNVSELTARVNDDGWDTVFAEWLKGSRLSSRDLVFVLSVGGGSVEKGISANIVKAIEHAKRVGARICGVVGRDGGATAKAADACVVIPTVDAAMVTPHAEAFQAVVWHLLVSHPDLAEQPMKWESVKKP
jgi:D-sedoheptulose 7-phosphate isomerase